MVPIIPLGKSSPNAGKNDIHNDTFDVSVEDIGKYSIGDEVEITIKGCIGMAALPPEVGIGGPRIGVKVYSQEIRKTGNAQIEDIRKLVEGEDDENPDGEMSDMMDD